MIKLHGVYEISWALPLFKLNLKPGVGNRPVITYAHLSQVDRVV